jgi:hypothetical protein
MNYKQFKRKKMKENFILVALLAITVVFVSCDTKEEQPEEKVLSVSYHHFGGDPGISIEMTFTAETTYFYHWYYDIGDNFKKKEIEVNNSTPNELWNFLLNKCDLDIFAKTKSGESNRPLDGTDKVFTITVKEKELSITNGYGVEYEQLHDFFDIIEEQVQQYLSNYPAK